MVISNVQVGMIKRLNLIPLPYVACSRCSHIQASSGSPAAYRIGTSATPNGAAATGIVNTLVSVVVSITEIDPSK